MPINRGQSKSTRWYQLCFVPTNLDSSDDSDTESVVLPASTSTSQEIYTTELSPPPSPPWSPSTRRNPEPDWLFLPPPRPPPINLEPEIILRFLQGSPRNQEPGIDSPFLTPRRNPEPEIILRFPPLPPPLNTEPEIILGSSQRSPRNQEPGTDSPFLTPLSSARPNAEPEIDWRFPPPPPAPTNPETEFQHDTTTHQPHTSNPEISDHNPFGSSSSTDESEFPRVPDSIMNAIFKVKISEQKEIQCPICMEDLKVGDEACRLPCIHMFCSKCILCWVSKNRTCPVCRFQLDRWEERQGISDNNLEFEIEIPMPEIRNGEYFFPTENSEDVNSDYDSASDGLARI